MNATTCNSLDNAVPVNRPARGRPLACFLAAAALLAATAAPAAGDTSPRYILFNAEYNSTLKQVSQTTVFVEKRLWKLDTRTGETWILVDVLQDGKDIRYWKKITDQPEE